MGGDNEIRTVGALPLMRIDEISDFCLEIGPSECDESFRDI
jgi:hypothetical protein